MEYLELFRALSQAKVKYLLCGGLAVNIYGVPRMTADIDILLDFEEENISNFEEVIRKMNYHPTIPLVLKKLINKPFRAEMVKERNLIAFSYSNSFSNYMTLDVLIDLPIEFDILWNKKEIRKVSDINIYLVSIDDLIVLKEYSNRIQDQSDVISLSKIKNGK